MPLRGSPGVGSALQPASIPDDQFDDGGEHGDAAGAAALFTDDGYWRDLVSFTWNIVTLEGRPAIADMLKIGRAHV